MQQIRTKQKLKQSRNADNIDSVEVPATFSSSAARAVVAVPCRRRRSGMQWRDLCTSLQGDHWCKCVDSFLLSVKRTQSSASIRSCLPKVGLRSVQAPPRGHAPRSGHVPPRSHAPSRTHMPSRSRIPSRNLMPSGSRVPQVQWGALKFVGKGTQNAASFAQQVLCWMG